MRYNLRIAGRDVTVVLEATGENSVEATVGSRSMQASYRVVDDTAIRLAVGGRPVKVYIAATPQGTFVNVEGTTWLVQDKDEDAQAGYRSRRPAQSPKEVTPPMPSVVVRILVNVGDRVDRGDGVVVVSAMKMETTLTAPFAGTVRKISCAEGDKVAPGMILVDIEPDGQGRAEDLGGDAGQGGM